MHNSEFYGRLSPYLHLQLFSFPLLPLLKSLLVYFSGFYLYSRHTPTNKEVVQPPFLYPLLEKYFFFTFLIFFVKSKKCVPTNLSAIHELKFSGKRLFFHFSFLISLPLYFVLDGNNKFWGFVPILNNLLVFAAIVIGFCCLLLFLRRITTKFNAIVLAVWLMLLFLFFKVLKEPPLF